MHVRIQGSWCDNSKSDGKPAYAAQAVKGLPSALETLSPTMCLVCFKSRSNRATSYIQQATPFLQMPIKIFFHVPLQLLLYKSMPLFLTCNLPRPPFVMCRCCYFFMCRYLCLFVCRCFHFFMCRCPINYLRISYCDTHLVGLCVTKETLLISEISLG